MFDMDSYTRKRAYCTPFIIIFGTQFYDYTVHV